MEKNYTFDGWVRQTDLRLRTLYPLIQTEIYEIQEEKYLIYTPREDLLVDDDFKKKFNYSIKNAALWCEITNDKPQKFLRIIPIVNDEQIGKSLDVLFKNQSMFNELFNIKFPKVNFRIHEMDENRNILIEINDKKYINEVKNFCISLNEPVTYTIGVDPNLVYSAPVKDRMTEGLDIHNFPEDKKIFPYLEEDDQFWINNIENIYAGKLKRKDFSFYTHKKCNCFIDYSVFFDTDIRNLILLYDRIYCSLPLKEYNEIFYTKQKITENDILYLVEKGFIKFIMTQPEYRLNTVFLKKVLERKSDAIIGRRTIAAFCLSNLVEVKNNYIFSNSRYHDLLYVLVENVSKKLNLDRDILLKQFLFPTVYLRESLYPLFLRGTKSFVFLSEMVSELFQKDKKDNIFFNCSTFEEGLQISNALDATAFHSYSGIPIQIGNTLGTFLSFYKGFTEDTLCSLVNNFSQRLTDANTILKPVDFLDFETDISLKELYQLNSSSEKEVGRHLFSFLGELNNQERKEQIERYKKLLKHFRREQNKKALNLDTGLQIGGLIPYLGTILGSFGLIKNVVSYMPNSSIANAISKINMLAMSKDEKELAFLNKLDNFASFKETS